MKFNFKTRYLNLILVVILSYISIKIIDNLGAILSGIGSFIGILTPFIIAFITAYILSPILNLVERRFKFKRGINVLITYSFVIVLITLFIRVLFPAIAESIQELINNIPFLTQKTQSFISTNMDNNEFLKGLAQSNSLKSSLQSYIPKLSSMLSSLGDTLVKSTISFTTSFINIVFGFIIGIYVLADKEKYVDLGKKLVYLIFKEKNGKKFLDFMNTLNYNFSVYIGAKALDSLIIALICFIGASILKSKYIIIVTVVVGVTNMIPYFGPVIGMVVAFLINVFYNPRTAVVVLIFLIILQQFDGWYLDPKITGNKVGITPFLTILGVTLGGAFFGVIGMILGVPIIAVVKIYVDRLLAEHFASDAKK